MTDPENLSRTAGQLRAEAEFAALIGRVIEDADSLQDAGQSLGSVATAKHAAADRLDEMVEDARLQYSSEGPGK